MSGAKQASTSRVCCIEFRVPECATTQPRGAKPNPRGGTISRRLDLTIQKRLNNRDASRRVTRHSRARLALAAARGPMSIPIDIGALSRHDTRPSSTTGYAPSAVPQAPSPPLPIRYAPRLCARPRRAGQKPGAMGWAPDADSLGRGSGPRGGEGWTAGWVFCFSGGGLAGGPVGVGGCHTPPVVM